MMAWEKDGGHLTVERFPSRLGGGGRYGSKLANVGTEHKPDRVLHQPLGLRMNHWRMSST
jgi:hypothetical protein